MTEPAKAAITLVFGAVAPPQGDVIELLAHLGCSKEVSSYEVTLHNNDGKYSPGGASAITVGLDGSISLGRGAEVPLLMTLRVEKVEYTSSPTVSTVKVSGRCWGERLFRRVVTANYAGMKGEEIVKDLMDYYAGLSHTRSGTELVEDTDTTYTELDYTDSPVWDILKYIAETSDKAGVIGYDFRVAPDGKFEFFPKNTKTNATAIVENIDNQSVFSKDITRIRNKITLYGLADKTNPADKVTWTRSLTPSDGAWAASSGVASLDAAGAPDGGACVKLTVSGSLYYGSIGFTLDPGKEIDAEFWPIIDLQTKLEATYSGTGNIILYDVSGKTAAKSISVSPDAAFHATEVGVGSAYVKQWDSVVSGFDWTQIKTVRVTFWFPEAVGAGAFWVHGLYFGGRRYTATEQDAASQAAYGLREYVETDEELWSDNECSLRAKALLSYLKDPAENITLTSTLLDYESSPILAGDTVHVHLPTEGVDSDFRVESVEYRVVAEDGELEATLELGKEPPQLADYIYGLRPYTVNVEKLSRTKLGKRGIPIGTQNGGTGANSYFTSNVDIDKTSPVLNLMTARALKAAFGFDGANVFAVSYVGDFIIRSANQLTRPFADDTDDFGSLSFAWRNAYIKRLCSVGSLDVGGFSVITAARVLQNITADAAVITSGQLPLSRMPRGTAGLILEAEGAGFDPMYVDPNGRYSPAAHAHPFSGISGLLAVSQLPQDTAGLVLEAQGAGFWPMYVNPNNRYLPAAHSHANLYPSGGGGTGNVGDTTTYWACVAADSVWYNALGHMDFLDDLATLRNIRAGKKTDEKGVPLIDNESLPEQMRSKSGLVHGGHLLGLLIGAIKQLDAKVKRLEEGAQEKENVTMKESETVVGGPSPTT